MSFKSYIELLNNLREDIQNDPSITPGDAILLTHYVCILKATTEERIEKGASLKKRKVIKLEHKVCPCGKPKAIYIWDKSYICQSCYRRNKKKR
jgi:hypothetical protein